VDVEDLAERTETVGGIIVPAVLAVELDAPLVPVSRPDVVLVVDVAAFAEL
jgi:hypothetical protein